jgi:hypothetical protein
MKSKQLAYLYLLGFLAMFAFTSQAFAREPVDPSTLNPPPRADTVCERVGNGIICDVQFSDPPFAGGSGVICGTGAKAYERTARISPRLPRQRIIPRFRQLVSAGVLRNLVERIRQGDQAAEAELVRQFTQRRKRGRSKIFSIPVSCFSFCNHSTFNGGAGARKTPSLSSGRGRSSHALRLPSSPN